jgi:hypothetical protein
MTSHSLQYVRRLMCAYSLATGRVERFDTITQQSSQLQDKVEFPRPTMRGGAGKRNTYLDRPRALPYGGTWVSINFQTCVTTPRGLAHLLVVQYPALRIMYLP